jgi:hypothetical protein
MFMERPPGRPQVSPTSRRICLALVLGWAGVGTAAWSWTAFDTLLPEERSWYYSAPAWAGGAAVVSVLALMVLWAVLPAVLLPVGLDYVRAARPSGWRWRGAWLGLVAAGIALEALPFMFPAAFLSALPNWNEFATSLGYAALGAAMIFVLAGPQIRRADLSAAGMAH